MRSLLNAILSALLAVLLLASTPTARADEFRSRLTDCTAVENDTERLACFDTLASSLVKPVNDEKAEGTELAAEPEKAPRVISLDDSVGSADDKTYVSRLASCSKASSSERQHYYLENGQVWRQSNKGRRGLRDCEAEIEIQKDVFGFKMSVPSQNRKIRVNRVR